MKKRLLFSLAVCGITSATAIAQVGSSSISINQVNANINSNGDLFWDYFNPKFEVPAGSSKHTIFADALWIGGFDTSGQLHLGAQTYRQTGNDFFNGPVSSSSAYNSAFDSTWARLWKIDRLQVENFVQWYANPSQYPNYTIPTSILTWPGNGNSNLGQATQLAPYVDLNVNGVYEPLLGDYPCMKGDQMIFAIFNDDRNIHTETGGQKLGIEIHLTVYAYAAPFSNWDSKAVFVNYQIYNRSQNTYSDVFVGKWTDFDLGSYLDDYVGCDVQRGMYYAYNGDANDGNSATPGPGTYGANPPAQGVMILRGPEADLVDGIDNNLDGTIDEAGEYCRMNRFMTYNNDFSVTGNPSTSSDFYNYLNSTWLDSVPATYGGNGYGGTTNTLFMYPDNSDPLGFGTGMQPQAAWSEVTANNQPGDRRGLASSGPFTFQPGEVLCLDYAYLYARGNNGPSSSIVRLQETADSARTMYDAKQPCDCEIILPTSTNELNASVRSISLYPNPASNVLFVNYEVRAANASWSITDITGRIVDTGLMAAGNSSAIAISELPAGIYTIRIIEGNAVSAARFVKE